MNAIGKFFGKSCIDRAMALDAAFSGKGCGNHFDTKMRFPTVMRATRMAGMPSVFV